MESIETHVWANLQGMVSFVNLITGGGGHSEIGKYLLEILLTISGLPL